MNTSKVLVAAVIVVVVALVVQHFTVKSLLMSLEVGDYIV